MYAFVRQSVRWKVPGPDLGAADTAGMGIVNGNICATMWAI